MKKKDCKECGETFKKKNKSYCSRECYMLYKKNNSKKGTILYFGKEFIERICAETISQSKSALDVIQSVGIGIEKDITIMEAVKGAWVIIGREAETLRHCMQDYNNNCLRPKHRYVRLINQRFLEDLETFTFKEDYTEASPQIVQLVRDLIQYLATFHQVLHEDTTDQERKDLTEQYCSL